MSQIFNRRNKNMKTNNFTFRNADIFDNAIKELSFFDNSSFNLEENDHWNEDNMIEQENDEEKDANLYIVSDSIWTIRNEWLNLNNQRLMHNFSTVSIMIFYKIRIFSFFAIF